jgi:hypothetical protein
LLCEARRGTGAEVAAAPHDTVQQSLWPCICSCEPSVCAPVRVLLCCVLAVCVPHRYIDQLRHLTTFDVDWAGVAVPTKAWCGVVEGLPVYLLEPQEPAAFFWRGQFYGQVCVRGVGAERDSMHGPSRVDG